MNYQRLLHLFGFSLIFLAGCATQLENKANDTATKTLAETATPAIHYRNFSIDTLYSLLVAEVAASRQQFDVTIENYLEQAYHTNDKAVIAQAARITQYFRRHKETLDMGELWLQHEPNNREAIVLVANAYLGLQQPLKALDYTEQLLTTAQLSEDAGAFFETIANYSKQTDSDTRQTLITRFQAHAQEYPTLAGIKVGLSILYQYQQSLDDAFSWIYAALQQEPDRNSAITQEILLLQQDNKTPLALNKLQSLLQKDPENNRLRLTYARLLTSKDTEKAYQQFTRLSEESPKQLDFKFSRALLAIETDRANIAKPLFEELLFAGYQPDNTRFYLGHTEEQLNNLNTALELYLAVIGGDNYLPARHRAGRILIQQNKLIEARQLFMLLRIQFPTRREQIYSTETNLWIDNQAYDAALDVLNEGLKIFPDSNELRYNRSTVHERQNKLALMESDLRHILTLDPDNVHALNSLGYYLTIRTQRYQEAYELIVKALKLRPEDAAVIDSMGWVKVKLGRYKEAIAHLKKAFSLYPDPEVAAHLGEALWLDGKQQEAKDILKKNLDQNPGAPEILETLKRLNITL